MSKRDKNTSGQQYILFDSTDDTDMVETQDINIKINGFNGKNPAESPVIDEVNTIATAPTIKFISFGSGSSGNCAYVGTENAGILIDAGVDADQVFKALKENNIQPESVKGICITHDHGDHIRYAYTIVRKYRHMHIYCTNRVMNGILRRHSITRRIKDYHIAIYKEITFEIAGLKITAFEVPHDGSDNAGFFIEYYDKNFTIATDLGHVSERAYHYMCKANYLMIESNYDNRMLNEGHYPEYLKNRIRAANGHLDNSDTARFIADNYTEALKYVFLCHLSNDNNTPEIARNEIIKALSEKNISVGNGESSIEDRSKDIQLVILPRYESSALFILRD